MTTGGVTLTAVNGAAWSPVSYYDGYAVRIDAGRDALLMTTSFQGSAPGGTALWRSTDGGWTWSLDDDFGPLGVAPCHGECEVAPDGLIGGNGTYLVAIENGGRQAWLSFDGSAWTPIAWSGGDLAATSGSGFGDFVVLPRGVMLNGACGAAK